jgi:hypothetical protein
MRVVDGNKSGIRGWTDQTVGNGKEKGKEGKIKKVSPFLSISNPAQGKFKKGSFELFLRFSLLLCLITKRDVFSFVP